MLTKRIIPCLDVNHGRVVKGRQFKNLRDVDDPVALGKAYSDAGADELVFYDITATHENRPVFTETVKAIAREISIPFTVGGGMRTTEDFREMLLAGADKVSVNSAAVLRPELISEAAERFGRQCVVLSIDGKRNDKGSWDVYVEGGRKNTGIDVLEWAKKGEALGAGEICMNSMDADGEKNGYDLDLLKALSEILTIPAIVQDARSGEILMMAWMNKESLQKTLEARETWFYSRSRQKLWHKGEESGHIQHIERLYIDCDEDTIVAQVLPEGPACHTGNCTCFFRGIEGFTNQETKGTLSILHALSEEIKDRKKNPQPKSYTNYLLAEGSDKIDKKIGEEASEVIIADQRKDKKEITSESCDLLYHLFVLWENAGIDLYDIMAEMERRDEVKGNKKTVGHLDKTF